MAKKKILITGQSSYIGQNLKNWLLKDPEVYEVSSISVRNNEWESHDFSEYDVVVHVAGIAHVSADPKLEELYYKVNRDLAIRVAEKAKDEKVNQFIFMSSIIIYGEDGGIGQKFIINRDTLPNPKDFYGRSKMEADMAIQRLNSEQFKTVIVRIPMVYGPNCKGNFPKLKKFGLLSPVFPKINNTRSMIYIDNLCEFLRVAIDNEIKGVFFPQNKEYMSTKEIIRTISQISGKKTKFINWFNPLLKMLSKKVLLINKVFGNKAYDKSTLPPFNYCIVDNETSIRKSI